MTYCVGMLLDEGLVMLTDSRTNAGVDQISTFPKMYVWEKPGDRVIIMLTAGNLAVAQSVASMLSDDRNNEDGQTLYDTESMFQSARLVGARVREVFRIDGESLRAQGNEFNVSIILGGQVKGGKARMFQIYSAGNFIESTSETPYFQIGETKYGKPIIDRVVKPETNLMQAAKCALVSMDSTLRSNISVGLPLDVAIYRRDALRMALRKRIDHRDTYFADIRNLWSEGLRSVFQQIPDPDWTF